jgi:hypothetical protein
MNALNRFKMSVALAVAMTLPAICNGCTQLGDTQNAVCCTEFKPGATIDAKIGGSANAQVTAQAVADFTGIASAAIEDLTTACRGIATDLGASQAEQDAANAASEKNDQMKLWCDAAVAAIGTFKGKAQVSLKLDVEPPKCEASFSAKANCQAKCSGSATCDVHATPPTCSGGPGSLSIACKGECKAQAGASLTCQGSCSAKCTGACTAKANVAVKCDGKCDGTCAADASIGNGAQGDGSCKGTCSGTCTARAGAELDCSGSCNGGCTGTCKAEAGGAVTCNGDCSVPDFEPIKCEGGELTGGCKVEASCDANCDASVSAKAECQPPQIVLTFAGAADAEAAAKLKATLEANLPAVFAFQGKLQAMLRVGKNLLSEASVKAVGELKASCILVVGTAAGRAVTTDIPNALAATTSIMGTLKP